MEDEDNTDVDQMCNRMIRDLAKNARRKCRRSVALGAACMLLAAVGLFDLGIGILHWQTWAVVFGSCLATALLDGAKRNSEFADSLDYIQEFSSKYIK